MFERIEAILRNLPPKQVPVGLIAKIQNAIQKEAQLRSLRRRAVAFATSFVVLAGFMVAYWNMFLGEMSNSAFMAYLKVILSDYDVALVYWKEMALSLLESLPVVNLIAVSLLVFFGLSLISKLLQIRSQKTHLNHPHHLMLSLK